MQGLLATYVYSQSTGAEVLYEGSGAAMHYTLLANR